MFYFQKIVDFLKNLTDNELKDFMVINFSEYFKSMREKLYSKLSEEQNLREFIDLLYIFLATTDEEQKYEEQKTLNP